MRGGAAWAALTARKSRWRLLLAISVAVGSALVAPTASQAESDPQYLPLPDQPYGGVYFITQQYRDLLDREPDALGLQYWVDQLDAGLAPAELVSSLAQSAEFGGSREPIARLYLAAFGRLPDQAGWAHWSDQLRAGSSLTAIAELFIESTEGIARFGENDATRLLDSLYQNVLDRPPDIAGAAYWRAQLDAGLSPGNLLVGFSESPEFAATANNQIAASLLYAGLLGRSPDPAGLTYWADQLAAGQTFARLAGGFLASPEYSDRLSGLWCQILSPGDVKLFDGPEPPTFGDAYQRMQGNARAVAGTYTGPYNELPYYALDRWPDQNLLVTLHHSVIKKSCLTFLAKAPYPDQIAFRRTPNLNAELDAARADVLDQLQGARFLSIGMNGGVGLAVSTSSDSLPVVDDLLAQHGELIESLHVGSFQYPMPDPLPDSVCLNEPANTVAPSELGLEVTVDLGAATTRPGKGLSGTFTIQNTGSRTVEVSWGAEVTGYLGSGSTSTSVFVGIQDLPATVFQLEPGESAEGLLVVATEACDPTGGHRLAPGPYNLWGSISAAELAEVDGAPIGSDYQIRLPATAITLTN